MRVTPCFVDETGSLHHTGQPLLAVGVLVVKDVGALTDALHTASLNFNSKIRQERLKVQRDIQQIHAGNGSLKDFQMLLAKTVTMSTSSQELTTETFKTTSRS